MSGKVEVEGVIRVQPGLVGGFALAGVYHAAVLHELRVVQHQAVLLDVREVQVRGVGVGHLYLLHLIGLAKEADGLAVELAVRVAEEHLAAVKSVVRPGESVIVLRGEDDEVGVYGAGFGGVLELEAVPLPDGAYAPGAVGEHILYLRAVGGGDLPRLGLYGVELLLLHAGEAEVYVPGAAAVYHVLNAGIEGEGGGHRHQ